MLKSSYLSIALAALIIAVLALFVADIHPGENGLLQNYPAEARHWSTVNYYSDNQRGYQISAAVWVR